MTAEASGGGSQGISKSASLYDKCKEAGILPVLERYGLRWLEPDANLHGRWRFDHERTRGYAWTCDYFVEHIICSIAQEEGASSSDGLVVMNYGDYGENEWKVMIYAEGMAYKPVYSTRLDACIAMLRLVTDHVKAGDD